MITWASTSFSPRAASFRFRNYQDVEVLTHIVSVSPQVSEPAHTKSEIDLPLTGIVSGSIVRFAGWFVLEGPLRQVRVEAVLREFNDKALCSRFAAERSDVTESIQLDPGHAAYGFELSAHRFDLPPSFCIAIWAYIPDENGSEQGVVICEIKGTNSISAPSPKPRFTPVYVVGLGRSGTTVLMRMLSKHPSLVCGTKYPLELCVSAYHAKLLKIATSSAAPETFSMPQIFSGPYAGPNPFASFGIVPEDVLNKIMAQTHEAGIGHAQRSNDIWYASLADHQRKNAPKYFVEKSVPNQLLVNALNYYADSKIVLLVRNPKDIFLSRVRFNRRRGYKDFGEQVAKNFDDWARAQSNECRFLRAIHSNFGERVVHVVKYESLMADSRAVLGRLCESLGIEANGDALNTMLEMTDADQTEHTSHRTKETDWAEEAQFLPSVERIFSSELSTFCEAYGYS